MISRRRTKWWTREPKHERWSMISLYFYNIAFTGEGPIDRFPRTRHLFVDIRFYLFIKNFQLFSRICFGTKLRFSSVSSRVYELPRYILFPELTIRFSSCAPAFSHGLKPCPSLSGKPSNKQRRNDTVSYSWCSRCRYRKSIFNARDRRQFILNYRQ